MLGLGIEPWGGGGTADSPFQESEAIAADALRLAMRNEDVKTTLSRPIPMHTLLILKHAQVDASEGLCLSARMHSRRRPAERIVNSR